MPNPSKVVKAECEIASLHLTLQLPSDDLYFLTRSEYLDLLAGLLGAWGAEALTFGEVSTDAQKDLRRAADIARRLLKEYRMRERLGAVPFEPERRPLVSSVGNGPSGGKQLPEATNRATERSVDETEPPGREILSNRKSQLQALIRCLPPEGGHGRNGAAATVGR